MYARLLFVNKQVEQARNTFEALLNNYPKRTDLWNVYIDLEIKNGS